MTDLVAVARKWGNSIGVTFSKELVEKQRIKPNDRIVISVRKAKRIESLFGTLKTKKSAQARRSKERTPIFYESAGEAQDAKILETLAAG